MKNVLTGLAVFVMFASSLLADNPIIKHLFTADPSAHLYEGKVFIYPSHDQDNPDWFNMVDYHVFSSTNLVDWTDHGVALHVKDVPWAKEYMWAPDCAYKDGTYYFYFPAKDHDGNFRIGVATSTSPAGPFKPEPKPIEGSFSIDPAVFIDDDGSAYMYFGGLGGKKAEAKSPMVARLKPNMKEFDEEPRSVEGVDFFFEGSWMNKINGTYYLSYSTGDKHKKYRPSVLAYATSDSPYGPFKYRGVFLKPVGVWTSHHSIIDINGDWYLFYHNGGLKGGGNNNRSVCIDRLYFNPDGTIKMVEPTKEGVPAVNLGKPTMKGFLNSFAMGAAIPGAELNEAERRLLFANFNTVTPENCMKPAALHPAEGRFRFAEADALVEMAHANGLTVNGPALLWHNQCPDWFFTDDGWQAGRELVLQRMRAHIAGVAGHFAGKVQSWDVVNEAIDDKDEYLRKSKWLTSIGEDFIAEAFIAAQKADPKAELYYNDYKIEQQPKRDKALRLIRDLKQRGAPIHGIGIQGHWKLNQIPFKDIEDAILAFHSEGMQVAITELDIDVGIRKTAGAEVGVSEQDRADIFANGLPDDVQQRLADQYARLFELFLKHQDKITRVTFWGLHDGRSWLNYWPYKRTNHPLLWDRALESKPALSAVLALTLEETNKNAQPPTGGDGKPAPQP
jgi:GH35 family endo-1,4-beta-xylanase